MILTKGRLINVSNRLPVQIRKYSGALRAVHSSGGLATALDTLWGDQPGVWIGWPGEAHGRQVQTLLADAWKDRPQQLQAVMLSPDEIAKFYAGFANEIVWPLFHDLQSQCNFDPEYWETYEQVNRKFAAAICETAEQDDCIWVHDYHLMLVARYLREMGSRACVGFFQHIPFPSPDIFEKLPWRESILQALLEYDVTGFQTERDRDNFLNCLRRLLPGARIEPTSPYPTVQFRARRTLVGAFPISIDFETFSGIAAKPGVAYRSAAIRKDLGEKIVVLGVDRLDYTKGIPERLEAFRVLLRRFPELRRQITLVQVVVPSRSDIPKYRELRLEIERLVSQINGEFTQTGWVPIHYMHRSLRRDELVAHYRAADIALITPLKDGMNLVAKEFCASQLDERGVLVVSEFAGAAQELRPGAILVNPYDFVGVAQAIYHASQMDQEEKHRRMSRLREIVRRNDVYCWARSFLETVTSQKNGTPAVAGGGGETDEMPRTALPRDVPGVALVAAAPASVSRPFQRGLINRAEDLTDLGKRWWGPFPR
ncbi:MAG TPA: trehalose-6-phosphate synthase [Terriglobales bacterium]|nr:trehalose-6-phosphate synthase [Terriglobales bacterium]